MPDMRGQAFILVVAMLMVAGGVWGTMYSVCSIMECSVGEFIKDSWPFLLALLVLIALLIVFPSVTLFIPDLIFG